MHRDTIHSPTTVPRDGLSPAPGREGRAAAAGEAEAAGRRLGPPLPGASLPRARVGAPGPECGPASPEPHPLAQGPPPAPKSGAYLRQHPAPCPLGPSLSSPPAPPPRRGGASLLRSTRKGEVERGRRVPSPHRSLPARPAPVCAASAPPSRLTARRGGAGRGQAAAAAPVNGQREREGAQARQRGVWQTDLASPAAHAPGRRRRRRAGDFGRQVRRRHQRAPAAGAGAHARWRGGRGGGAGETASRRGRGEAVGTSGCVSATAASRGFPRRGC